MAKSKSPTGQWSAILLSEKCMSATRYCPAISHVAVVANARQPRVSESAFSIESASMVELTWKSDSRLIIRYWPLGRILKRTNTVGPVQIEYQPVLFL